MEMSLYFSLQVLLSPWAGVFAKDKPKSVQAWQDRIFARPAVQKGLVSRVPCLSRGTIATKISLRRQHVPTYNKMIDMCNDPDFESKYSAEAEKHAKQSASWIQKGMKEDAQQRESKV